MSREKALSLIERGFSTQKVSEEALDTLRIIKQNIDSIVSSHGTDDDKADWDLFFHTKIPLSTADQRLCTSRHDTWLHHLYSRCGGPIRRKTYEHLEPKVPIQHFADSLIYPLGVLNKKTRDEILNYAEKNAANVYIRKGEKSRSRTSKLPETGIIQDVFVITRY